MNNGWLHHLNYWVELSCISWFSYQSISAWSVHCIWFLVTDRWMVQRELLDRASQGGGRERVLLRWRIGFLHHLNIYMIYKFWLWYYLPLQELVGGKMGLKKPSGSKLGIGTILSISSIFGFVNYTDIDNIEKVWNIGTVKKECITRGFFCAPHQIRIFILILFLTVL